MGLGPLQEETGGSLFPISALHHMKIRKTGTTCKPGSGPHQNLTMLAH